MELEAPSSVRYLLGATIMIANVVLPLAYMTFRNKRSPLLRPSKEKIEPADGSPGYGSMPPYWPNTTSSCLLIGGIQFC
ncbi:hypothetical protein ZWY2020_004544 [Hordeum vulgare]|nr:hypothetical protein ZWY2020_004544 [Hordeum vulgare]